MRQRMSDPTAVLYMPLDRAMVCISCACLFEAGHRQCPACTSQEFRPVASWLDREQGGQ